MKTRVITNKNLIITVLIVVTCVLVGDLFILYNHMNSLQTEINSFNESIKEVKSEQVRAENRMDIGKVNVGLVVVVIIIAGGIYFGGYGPQEIGELFNSMSNHGTNLANNSIKGVSEVGKTIVDAVGSDTKALNGKLSSIESSLREGFEVVSKQIQSVTGPKSSLDNVFEGKSEPKFK